MNLAGPDTAVIALIKYPAVRLTINIQHFLSNKKCLPKYLIPGVHPPSSRQTRKIFLCFVSTPLWIFPLAEASQWALKITLSCLTWRKNYYKLLEKFTQPVGRVNKQQGSSALLGVFKLHTFITVIVISLMWINSFSTFRDKDLPLNDFLIYHLKDEFAGV